MLGKPRKLTSAQEDYLKALYQLHGDAQSVPTGDLAQRLHISSASVSEMVVRLGTQGLIEHDRYRGQQLTTEGRAIALHLVRHHRLLEMFLVEVLGYSVDEVHEEAEKLEHVMSERMESRIFDLLGRPELDPHGHSIPSAGGEVKPMSDRSLLDCRPGENVVVQSVSDDDPERLRELKDRGILPGRQIEIIAESKFDGPIDVRIGGHDDQVPLGLARAIFVEGMD